MKPKVRVLICDPIGEVGVDKLRRAGFDVNETPTVSATQLRNVVSNYDALIVRSRTKVTKEVLEVAKRLKVIGRAGAGLDNIDVETAEQKGIAVLNAPEALADAVAELTIGLMLSLLRSISLADRSMKEGKWLKKRLMGWQLKGKTLGTIGLGNVGGRVARIAKTFGMKILMTYRTLPDPELLKELKAEFFWNLVPLEVLLRRSDIVTIHAPLTRQTYHMIGEKEFCYVKNGAFIINTSRGAIMDEMALLNALKSGKLGGAALDVYEIEPPENLSLIRLRNVICTPHIGAQTKEAQEKAATLIAEKIINSFE